jgi:hypothetical protein
MKAASGGVAIAVSDEKMSTNQKANQRDEWATAA